LLPIIGPGEGTKMPARRSIIGGRSLLFGRKGSQPNNRIVDEDRRLPSGGVLGGINTLEARRAVAAHVPHILALATIPQICDAVVGAVSVDVINSSSRMLAIHVKPRQPMTIVSTPV